MPDKSNDTASRIKHATGQGFAYTIPAKRKFGTPEEVGNRVGGTFKTLPDNAATNFRQLGPQSTGASGVTVDTPIKTRSGNQKYGNPRRYV